MYPSKYIYNHIPSIESVKGALGNIGNDMKNVYNTSVECTKGVLNSVGSSLYSRFHGTKVSSLEEQFEREDGSKLSMQELTPLDYLDPAVPSSEQKQRANSLDYLNIDNVPKHLSIDAAKEYLMSLSEDQNVFYAEKEETKVNGYLDQVVSTVNYFVHQAVKATPYLAATCLPYVFYNYATTPVQHRLMMLT